MRKVCQFKPYIDPDDIMSLADSFDENWITEGPKSKEFTEKICEIAGTKYGVLAPNGTLALYLALKALGIGNGDRVIVPNFTFIASANAVEMVGAKPLFVDIDINNLQIDIEKCESLLSQKPKAIMPVPLYGLTPDLHKIKDFAKKNNLLMIEDSAQALGVEWKGKPCGSFGDAACFSFFADKTITTGEGGFVATNNEEIYNKLLFLRNQGRKNRGSFIHPEIGYNFRMTDMQTSLGLSQLEKFGEIKSKKIKIFEKYCALLDKTKGVKILKPEKDITSFIPFRVILLTEEKKAKELMDYMGAFGIESRSAFFPLHQQPCFKEFFMTQFFNFNKFEVEANLKNSIDAYDRAICLPSYASLEEKDVKYVCQTIKSFYNNR